MRNYEKTGKEKELNPKIENRNAGPKKTPDRNHFTEDQVGALQSAFHDGNFEYQKVWFRSSEQRTRMILKSRQIGATWYFARQALIDAITTGRNQIFLSASKSQAHIFKQYIKQFAGDAVGVELSGDPIVLSNGAHIYFLGTNARTAQGYHGNFYFDEFFWTQKFTELNTVASRMLFCTMNAGRHHAIDSDVRLLYPPDLRPPRRLRRGQACARAASQGRDGGERDRRRPGRADDRHLRSARRAGQGRDAALRDGHADDRRADDVQGRRAVVLGHDDATPAEHR